MAPDGLRGFLEGVSPWIVCFWCLAHRLELSIQDAFKKFFFFPVLMSFYYSYIIGIEILLKSVRSLRILWYPFY